MKQKLKDNCRWVAARNSFEYRFYYEGKRYSVYAKTEKEAIRKGNEKALFLQNQQDIDNLNITLNKYYEDIYLVEQQKTVKESTLYYYEKQWKHIKPLLGHRKLRSLNKADILCFQKEMLNTKVKPRHGESRQVSAATINRCTKHLKQILASAVRDRIITFNPCENVKPMKDMKPKAADHIHRALTEEETALFMQRASDTHYYFLFKFLLNSGCRIGEALSLTWKDVDVQKREIQIHSTLSRTGNKEYRKMESPKTDSSIRIIPLTGALESILKAQKQQNRYLSGNPFEKRIFLNSRGSEATYNSVDSCIDNIVKQLNQNQVFERFSVHAFRDTFATRCIEQGMQPQTLKVILGHSSLKMTMDLYAHVMPNTRAMELEKIQIAM